MAESVKVIVRCRPMNEREKGLKCDEVILIDNTLAQCSIRNPGEKSAPPKNFTFDGAYGTDSITEQIYLDIGFPLVEGVTEGYNGTIFAYGQTGSGKSFSMQGITNPSTQRGIIPRAFDHIFETIQVTEGSKFLVHASYLEIYNEEVRDLLGKDIKRKLELKEHPDKGVYIQDLSKNICKNVGDCERVMERGWKNRSTGSTLMNADSSRSHSIFTIHLERCETDAAGKDHIRGAKLNLVDLAGSERQSKTGATGDRFKEATKINLSLSALGNVISALVDGKSTHIPYRDSKLTRLLQDSLGGNTKTLMVACLSPADNNYEETLSTLRYANRAKNIKNKPKINEDPKDAMIREYREEIERLKAMLKGDVPISKEDASKAKKEKELAAAKIEEEKKKLQKEYEKELKKIKGELNAAKASKQEIEEEMNNIKVEYERKLATVEDTRKDVTDKKKRSKREESVVLTNDDDDYDDDIDDNVELEGSDMNDSKHDSRRKASKSRSKSSKRKDVGSTFDPSSDGNSIVDESQETEKSSGQKGKKIRNVSGVTEDVRNVSDVRRGERNVSEQYSENRGSDVELNAAMKRIQELEQNLNLVGGEQAGNRELKERRQKKLSHAEQRRRKLLDLIAMNGEDILVNIYENINDELRAQRKQLVQEKQNSTSLQREILDLHSEFESDRRDYLETIRAHEKHVKYLQTFIDRVVPTLRHDCNYINAERIRSQSVWDDVNQQWNLPKMALEKTYLPPAVAGGYERPARPDGMPQVSNGDIHASVYDHEPHERLQQKLASSDNSQTVNSFKNNRALDLVRNATPKTLGSHSASANVLYQSDYDTSTRRSTSGSAPSASGTDTDPSFTPSRRPIRLEKLELTSAKKDRKQKY